jgi:hypothetical protein
MTSPSKSEDPNRVATGRWHRWTVAVVGGKHVKEEEMLEEEETAQRQKNSVLGAQEKLRCPVDRPQ